MKNFFSIVLLSTFYFLLSASAADAAVSCQPIYGGGQTCVQVGEVRIEKTVDQQTFGPDSVVNFTITVTNTGHANLPRIVVKDILPLYLKDITGVGTYDANTRNLTFEVLNLAAGESRKFTFSPKVVPSKDLPMDQGTVCVINQAIALVDNNPVSQANAQLCIQKQVLAQVAPPTVTKGGLKVQPAPQVVTTPPTGPEALALFALIPSALAGHFLRKQSMNPTSLKFRRARGGEK